MMSIKQEDCPVTVIKEECKSDNSEGESAVLCDVMGIKNEIKHKMEIEEFKMKLEKGPVDITFKELEGELKGERSSDSDSEENTTDSGKHQSSILCDVGMEEEVQSKGNTKVEKNRNEGTQCQNSIKVENDNIKQEDIVKIETEDTVILMKDDQTNEGDRDVGLNSCLLKLNGASRNARTSMDKKISFTPKAKCTMECDFCSKVFSKRMDLLNHVRAHMGIKPHTCQVCGKCFTQQTTLVSHLRTHAVHKEFRCADCTKSFARKQQLAEHVRVHTGDKPYTCEVCDNSFATRTSLRVHGRKHTGQEPYKCEQCDKCFNYHSHFKAHIRTHTGEKPYGCAVCKKSFSQRSDLTSHLRIHTGDKPYSCAVCRHSFKQSTQLLKHMKGKHGHHN